MFHFILVLAALFVVLLLATMYRRCLLIAFFHFGGCLVCILWIQRLASPGSPVSQTLGFTLYALATLPFGWTIPAFHLSEGNANGVLLQNSLAWAATVEWLLRLFVDQRRSSGAE